MALFSLHLVGQQPAEVARMRLLDPEGKALDGANVILVKGPRKAVEARGLESFGCFGRDYFGTDIVDGHVSLKDIVAGQYAAWIIAPPWAPTLSPEFTIPVVLPPGDDLVVTVSMQRGAIVEGRLFDAQGQPVSCAEVITWSPYDTLDFGSNFGVRHMMVTRTSAHSDARGRFELLGMIPGDYEIEVRHPDQVWCRRYLTIDGTPKQQLEDIHMEHGARIEGIAFLDGRPAKDVKVQIRRPDPPHKHYPEPWLVDVLSDDRGWFVLPSRVPPGTWRLFAWQWRQPNPFGFLIHRKESEREVTVVPGQAVVGYVPLLSTPTR